MSAKHAKPVTFSNGALHPDIRFQTCPIKASLGILGRKWAMLVIRDIGFRHIDRFNRLLESIRGITPRVLSMRLKELESDGIIERVEDDDSPGVVRWGLTDKGQDTLPILMRLIAYGSKWHARDVFEDETPRSLQEIFTRPESRELVQRLYTT